MTSMIGGRLGAHSVVQNTSDCNAGIIPELASAVKPNSRSHLFIINSELCRLFVHSSVEPVKTCQKALASPSSASGSVKSSWSRWRLGVPSCETSNATFPNSYVYVHYPYLTHLPTQ
jgi:hypothetical protein